MTEFVNWRQRLEAKGGVVPDRIRVTRENTREDQKQKNSHEQQMADMEEEWGPVDPAWWWKESRSGTSFDRPGLQDVLDFCRSNPPPNGEGRVEWWAPHRLGRALDADGNPDTIAFMGVLQSFKETGWHLHFLKVPRTGHDLADVIRFTVSAYAQHHRRHLRDTRAERGPTPNEGGSTTEFVNWRQRIEAQGGVVPDRIRVTRKSSRENHKQQFSHAQQMAAMEKEWGSVDPAWCWEESHSGTSFDRPGFQDLLDFCKSNPPPNGKGRVEWWAPHRFGRILDRNGEPDILAFISVYNDFEQANWELHFLTVPRTGNGLVDVIRFAVSAYAQ